MIVSAVFTRVVVGEPRITTVLDTSPREVQGPVIVVGFDGPRDHLTVCIDPADAARLRDALTDALAEQAAA